MRLSRKSLVSIAAVTIFLLLAGASLASVVTIDVSSKAAKSDVDALNPMGLQFSGQQIGLCVQSTVMAPQLFTLKAKGLASGSYDLYVNENFKGTKTAAQLEQGIELRLNGRVAEESLMRCLTEIQPGLEKAYALVKGAKDPQTEHVAGTLNDAREFAKSATRLEQAWRSVAIIIAPSGKPLEEMSFMMGTDAQENATQMSRACWLLQQTRNILYTTIDNPDLRNQGLAAVTPVFLSANYSTSGDKPHVYVKLANDCNLPIGGTVSLQLPQGWKTGAKKLSFAQLKSGAKFEVICNLIAPSKAAPLDSVPVAATFSVVQDDFKAILTLKTTAKASGK